MRGAGQPAAICRGAATVGWCSSCRAIVERRARSVQVLIILHGGDVVDVIRLLVPLALVGPVDYESDEQHNDEHNHTRNDGRVR